MISCAVGSDSERKTSDRSQVVHLIEPLKDPRWDDFIQRHPRSSVFHSSPWLQTLSQTYGFEAVAYTTSQPDTDLEDGVVFCRIDSWLTGRRLVSLPFSDHCALLVDTERDWKLLTSAIERELQKKIWRYVELRSLQYSGTRINASRTSIDYSFHKLDLHASIDTIFNNFHKSSIQRKIHRAARERLTYREGSTEALLKEFYSLFRLTRKRHKLPPQPWQWFVNLVKCFGNTLKIRVAYKGERPVAAMITLRHKDTLYYKYGCSDPDFHNLGSMQLLFWQAIQEAKNEKLNFLDFGRTDAGQQGLGTFKKRWGAVQSELTYLRYSMHESSTHFLDPSTRWKVTTAKRAISCLPGSIVSRLGEVLYGHIG